MSYLGDRPVGSVIYSDFNSKKPNTGAPYLLDGSPALAVFKDGGTSPITAGVSLSVSHGGVLGLNVFSINTASDPEIYTAGSDYRVQITAGTVDGISVVGDIVGRFTLGVIPTSAQNADRLLGRNQKGGTDGGRTVSQSLAPLRNKTVAQNGHIYVYDTDDSTLLFSFLATSSNSAKPITSMTPE